MRRLVDVAVIPVVIALVLLSAYVQRVAAAVPPPDPAEVRAKFTISLPAYWKVAEFDIQATANYGNDVEPEFRQRIVAAVSPVADLFVSAGTEDAVPGVPPPTMLEPSAKAGETRQIFLLATSQLHAGAWDVKFQPENDPLRNSGQPRASFGGFTIVKGSAEEAAYRAKRKDAADRVQQEALDRMARDDALRRARDKEADEARADAERTFRASLTNLTNNISNVVAAQLPAWWKLKHVDVSDPARTPAPAGTVAVTQRFTATIALAEDTFVAAGEIGSAKLLMRALAAGVERQLDGTAASVRREDAWQTSVSIATAIPSNAGQPRAYFQTKTIVRASAEEEEYRKELDTSAEAEKQAAIAAIKRQQEIEAAKLAAEQALTDQKADAEAAELKRQQDLQGAKLAAAQALANRKAEAEAEEQKRQQKLAAEGKAQREQQLASLAAALAGSDVAKRQSTVKTALGSGDEDQISMVLADALGRTRGLGGSLTALGCPSGNPKTIPFSVEVSDFDRRDKAFHFRFAVLGSQGAGTGNLQGSTLQLTTEHGSHFTGDFDGHNKFVGDLSLSDIQAGFCNYGLGIATQPSYRAELKVL